MEQNKKIILARLSYNTKRWTKPSGPEGKSKSQIHEHIYGFGFEEWIFNEKFKDKDGYHFGYIDGIRKNYRLCDNVVIAIFIN